MLVAKVKKIFLEISIKEKRDVLRYIWYEVIPEKGGQLPKIVNRRITRVTFKSTSTPFLLLGTRLHYINNLSN